MGLIFSLFISRRKPARLKRSGVYGSKTRGTLAVLSFAIHPLPPDAVVDDITLEAAEKRRVPKG
jgi:hypothetical protein